MDTTAVKAARAVAKEIARIDARIRKKLLKRARKHDMTEAEAIELAENVEACGEVYETPTPRVWPAQSTLGRRRAPWSGLAIELRHLTE
jgi:hypothetical protein